MRLLQKLAYRESHIRLPVHPRYVSKLPNNFQLNLVLQVNTKKCQALVWFISAKCNS
jgi:hypothetical protein